MCVKEASWRRIPENEMLGARAILNRLTECGTDITHHNLELYS